MSKVGTSLNPQFDPPESAPAWAAKLFCRCTSFLSAGIYPEYKITNRFCNRPSLFFTFCASPFLQFPAIIFTKCNATEIKNNR